MQNCSKNIVQFVTIWQFYASVINTHDISVCNPLTHIFQKYSCVWCKLAT